jgi:hypothetical protein
MSGLSASPPPHPTVASGLPPHDSALLSSFQTPTRSRCDPQFHHSLSLRSSARGRVKKEVGWLRSHSCGLPSLWWSLSQPLAPLISPYYTHKCTQTHTHTYTHTHSLSLSANPTPPQSSLAYSPQNLSSTPSIPHHHHVTYLQATNLHLHISDHQAHSFKNLY